MGNSSGDLADLVDDQYDLVLQAELSPSEIFLVSSFGRSNPMRDVEWSVTRLLMMPPLAKPKKDAESTEEELELKGYQDLRREVGIPSNDSIAERKRDPAILILGGSNNMPSDRLLWAQRSLEGNFRLMCLSSGTNCYPL